MIVIRLSFKHLVDLIITSLKFLGVVPGSLASVVSDC